MPRRFRRQRIIFFMVFLVPCIAYLLIWRIFPLIHTAYLSITSFNILKQNAPRFVGFSNYIKLAGDPVFINSLKLTFIFGGVATLLELILGLAMALLFDRGIKGKNIISGIILAPMILTPVVVGVVWYILYHDMVGPFNYLLRLMGFGGMKWLSSTSTAMLSIIIADIWQWTPFMFLLLLSALQVVPITLYEAARVDGASNLEEFRYITLPMIKDMILVALILRSMDAFRIFDKIFVMTGGGPGYSTEVTTIQIYRTAFNYFQMGYAASMVIVLLAVISALYSLYLKLT